MNKLPTVSSLWIGPELSFLEQLCLKSFVDAGHETKLYVYDEVKGIPEGVTVAPANDILPSSEFVYNKQHGAPGPHSDKFRYHMLSKTREIWVDTDAYCLRPFPDSDFLFARHYKSLVANGVLRLPQDSRTLKDLIDFTSTETPVLADDFPFFSKDFKSEYQSRSESGSPMHVSEMPWEIWGPHAITYFINRSNEVKHALPNEVLYPLGGGEIFRTLQKPFRAKIVLPDNCLSIHFYGSKIRGLVRKRGGVPQPKSLLGRLCTKHGINPEESPIV